MFRTIITLLAATAIAVSPKPAHAQTTHAHDGAWKVGNSYVIRFSNLDLDRPADRQKLLELIERSAGKLCSNLQTGASREACKQEVIRSSLAGAQAQVRSAIALAQVERNGALLGARNPSTPCPQNGRPERCFASSGPHLAFSLQ